MTTIYLPVEISRREIVAKSFLAAKLASHGHTVLVFRSDLFDRVGWPGPGIYIGKNVFRAAPPHDLSYLDAMKRSGIRVWYLDEEGGIYLGENEDDWRVLLAGRVDPSALDSADKILTWGDWQNEFFSTRGLNAPVHTTGHVNFDVCQPKYAAALAKFDARQTDGAEDYILVNTRFVICNAVENVAGHIIHKGTMRQFYDQDLLFDKLVADGKCYYDFIGLINVLSVKFPDRRIVLRPHPGEDAQTYVQIFAPLGNVDVIGSGDVGSWIRRADCVIHNGCTTAIQATIAGKPVITFMPTPDDPRTIACLPNQVGIPARTAGEVLEAINLHGSLKDQGHWRRTISALDTIDRIAEMVDLEAAAAGSAVAPEAVHRLAARFAMSEMLRTAARVFMPERRRSFGKYMELFDPGFFRQIGDLATSANAHYGAQTTVRRMSRFCYAFLPAPEKNAAGADGRPG